MNYARFGLLYLRSIERLPIDVAQCILKVMHHNKGIWNGILSDMFIETTFMRYGDGKRGMIGIKPDTMKVWALSLHPCKKLRQILPKCATLTSPSCQHIARKK